MKNIEIQIGDTLGTWDTGVTSWDVLKNITHSKPVIGVLWNRRLQSLLEPLLVPGILEPVFLEGSTGHKIYRRTLCFLLEMALRRTYPELSLHIGHSLGGGYFFFPPTGHPLSPEEIENLLGELKKLVKRNLKIEPVRLYYTQALEIFTAQGQEDSVQLIKQRNEHEVSCWCCDGYYDLDHFPLASQTSQVPVFDLVPHRQGCILHMPDKTWPLKLSPFQDKPILYSIYKEYQNWGDVLGISTVAELNHVAGTKEISEYIQVAETLQEKKLSDLADKIAKRKREIKLILVAGPSSSGKTTFTKKLSIHLKVLGFRPRIISLDDYFVPRDNTPKDADGNFDFENLRALDVELLNQDLLNLMEGKEVEIPIFDFKIGNRKDRGRKIAMGDRDILMMEGIHGLNDELTPLIPRNTKFKIYISALTQLNLDNHNRISTTDNRLLRRMVRDSQFRGYSALHTLKMWPSVRRGEDKNIFPFQDTGDAVFNTALDYELAVLCNYALPLLKSVPPTEPEYYHASRLIGFLENFTVILPQHVPLFSLLREFIGDSGFKY